MIPHFISAAGLSWSGEINIGNVLAAAAVILTLYSMHKANIARINEAGATAKAELAEIKIMVQTMWDDYKENRR